MRPAPGCLEFNPASTAYVWPGPKTSWAVDRVLGQKVIEGDGAVDFDSLVWSEEGERIR